MSSHSADTNERDRKTGLGERLAGASGEAATKGLWARTGVLASRAQGGEGMGGNVMKGVEVRSYVL